MLLVQNASWRTRALSAFAKLYAALHMQFLRLLHINLSTDFYSTSSLTFQIGDGSLFRDYISLFVYKGGDGHRPFKFIVLRYLLLQR